ncbi:MAG: DNA-binding response regulator [Ignavibacteriae bacterium HGW-Ignavibacteriae-3]|nr:MAG: DNA-binding response regulator [Ignavibacteriae bacterium HGW-Ignavibacteriae-3]
MAETKPIRIIIADDHKLFRSGVISLLDDVEDIIIIAEVESGNELIEKYSELMPDVMLVDISMPGMGGIDALKILRRNNKEVKAIILSMYDSDEYIYYAMKSGAKGMLSKNTMKGELIHAIKSVHDGNRYFGLRLTEDKIKELEKRYKKIISTDLENFEELNSRDKVVLESISKGLTSQEMADKMGVSKKTIDYYRARIMERLQIKSSPELVSYAVRYSLINKLFDE